MAGRLYELKGSGDFKAGPSGVNGKGLAVVLDAADQDDAFDLADGYFPAVVAGIPRGSIDVKDQGGGVFLVEVEYSSGVGEPAGAEAGQPPTGGREPAGEADPNQTIGREYSFSTGGATRRIFFSKETRHKVAEVNAEAPDFGGLIGVRLDGGEIEGCEVLAPAADFTITRRFAYLTLGWFRNMLDLVACTNSVPFVGMDVGEVLFKGCDGNYHDGDRQPWSVTGRFGYSRNRTIEDSPDELTVGGLEIPDVRGWDYVWFVYEKRTETVTINGVARDLIVQYPKFGYVERVYSEGDLATLGLA